MIEDIIISRLRAHEELQTYITTYQGVPSIFASVVPERAKFPNITVRIQRTGNDTVIEKFRISIDYWNYDKVNTSGAEERAVARIVEDLFDGYIYKDTGNPDYRDVRFWLSSPVGLMGDEPNKRHYTITLEARASRKRSIDYKS